MAHLFFIGFLVLATLGKVSAVIPAPLAIPAITACLASFGGDMVNQCQNQACQLVRQNCQGFISRFLDSTSNRLKNAIRCEVFCSGKKGEKIGSDLVEDWTTTLLPSKPEQGDLNQVSLFDALQSYVDRIEGAYTCLAGCSIKLTEHFLCHLLGNIGYNIDQNGEMTSAQQTNRIKSVHAIAAIFARMSVKNNRIYNENNHGQPGWDKTKLHEITDGKLLTWDKHCENELNEKKENTFKTNLNILGCAYKTWSLGSADQAKKTEYCRDHPEYVPSVNNNDASKKADEAFTKVVSQNKDLNIAQNTTIYQFIQNIYQNNINWSDLRLCTICQNLPQTACKPCEGGGCPQ